MSTPLKLSDLLVRTIQVEWHEGVALVREVAERVLERPDPFRVPELTEIELSAGGDISVVVTRGAAGTDEPVRRLGQLLQAILGLAEPPVQLRLLIAQATAPTPAFRSMREYHDALGYFERPDRAGVLQGLYARAVAAPAATDLSQVPTIDAIAPLPKEQGPANDPRVKSRSRSRRLWLASSAAMLSFACVVAVVYAKGIAVTEVGGEVSTVALKASDVLGSALVTGVSAVTDRVGLGRLATDHISKDPAAIVENGAQISVRRAPPARATRPVIAAESPAFQAFDLAPVATFYESVVVPASRLETPADVTGVDGQGAESDEIIYSADSDGVSPPIGVRPQLPRELPPNVELHQLTRIELVVSTDGTVESVKLLGDPGVRGAMLLSAVKAWQFQAATRDGLPVRYRKTVWITSR